MTELRPGLHIPHAKMISQTITDYVNNFEKTLLKDLPNHAMLLIAIDIWQSPYEQSFLAIAGYFIDKEWRLREVVLGFEPLYVPHSCDYIGQIIVRVLQKHGVEHRLYAITTDNASNNSQASAYVEIFCANHAKGRHIPCLAHVLQLSLGALLSNLNAQPTNETEVEHWDDGMAYGVDALSGVAQVVEKVRYILI